MATAFELECFDGGLEREPESLVELLVDSRWI